jgi:predicted permease
VVSAGYANQLPLVAIENSATLRRTPAPPPAGVPPDGAGGDARLVSRDYLQTMGVRLMAGRFFDERDGSGQPQALIINRTLARRSFTDRDPVGTIVYMGRGTEPWEIVGVVDDIRQARLDTPPAPQFFASLEQWTSPIVPVFPLGAYYAVRTSGSTATLLPILKQIVLRSSPQASIENLVTMDGIVSNALSQPRLYTVLLGTFAGIAVLLACAGIYGVVAYTVAQRTHEIGIRMALGAERWHVLGMVLHQIALLTAGGTLAGLAGAAATTRYLQTLLFGLTPLDATTFVVVALIFGLVATIAALIPARRAAAVDPIIALRVE